MKKLSYLIVFVTLLSVSCKPIRRDCCVLPQPGAAISAERNGLAWSARGVEGILSPTFEYTINATNIKSQTLPPVKIDSLSIKIAYNSPGVYTLAANQVYYGTFNPDGTLNSYNLDPSFNNEINITSYQTLDNPYTLNPNQIEIKGTFNLKFIDPSNPAGISFSNGSFYTIMNQP
jgi:hypothetical protein